MRKTKIVCTLGPAVENYGTVKRLIRAGMDVARVNMSHNDHEVHRSRIKLVKDAREELDAPVAILMDTKGPEIRIKTFKEEGIVLEDGQEFTLVAEDIEGDATRVGVSFVELPSYLVAGDTVLINDGLINLKVLEVHNNDIKCVVINGGPISNRKAINLPGKNIDMPYLSDQDKTDLLFAIEQDADYIALSFVRTAEDIKATRSFLRVNGGEEIQLIAKIENRQGVDNAAQILELSDGLMVARGDMGVEIPFEELPAIQKKLIATCYQKGKKVITATQMLESMIVNPRPTRAEICDVANAIYDGTSSIMLSGETAIGKFPVEAVATMAKIAVNAENSINYKKRFKNLDMEIVTITDAISHSAVAASYGLNAKAIVTVTRSGYTARKVSRYRPSCVIIGATTSRKVYNQMALNWGVVPTMGSVQTSTEMLFKHSMVCAKNTGLVSEGDLIVEVGSTRVERTGSSNALRIEVV